MNKPPASTHRSLVATSIAVALATAAVASAGCGDSSPAAPSTVPEGDTAAIGADGAVVTKAQFDRFLSAQVKGTSPIGGSVGGAIPLDPPDFPRCKAALVENASRNRQPRPTATQLTAACKSQYSQTKAAVQSQLISYQWLLQEAKAAGVSVDRKEIDQTLKQYISASAGAKASASSAKARFNERLKQSSMTIADVRLQLEAQIAQQKLSTRDGGGNVDEPSTDEAKTFYSGNKALFAPAPGKSAPPFDQIAEQVKAQLKSTRLQVKQVEFQNNLQRKWRAATLCAKGYIVAQCSNGPKLPDLTPPKTD